MILLGILKLIFSVFIGIVWLSTGLFELLFGASLALLDISLALGHLLLSWLSVLQRAFPLLLSNLLWLHRFLTFVDSIWLDADKVLILRQLLVLARLHFPDLTGRRGHLVLQLILMNNVGGAISVLAHSHLTLLD